MNKLTLTLAAAVLSIAGTSVAMADGSATDALSSAHFVGIQTVSPAGAINASAGQGRFELVDLVSLKAQISQNPALVSQLANYGSSVDNVVGISGTNETNVTIYVKS